MYNRYEYIRRRAKELSRLCWLSHKVSINNDLNAITVTVSKENRVHEFVFTINQLFPKKNIDRKYINNHLKKLYFDLIEECFEEKDKENEC